MQSLSQFRYNLFRALTSLVKTGFQVIDNEFGAALARMHFCLRHRTVHFMVLLVFLRRQGAYIADLWMGIDFFIGQILRHGSHIRGYL